MPIYEYLCKECNEITVETKASTESQDAPACKTCNSPTKRLYSSIGVSFKGSGFYSTDK